MVKGHGFVQKLSMTLFTLVLLFVFSETTVRAQDGPQCPPGFQFDRLSGVGCVQENCFSINQAYFSYTGQCICADNFKMCSKPVDYEKFDGQNCGPFCPFSELISCVSLDSECPVDISQPTQSIFQDNGPDQPFLQEFENKEPQSQNDSMTDLLEDLERFLTNSTEGEITPGETAAAGSALVSLLSAWIITQLLSGYQIKDLLKTISTFFGKNPVNQIESSIHKDNIDNNNGVVSSSIPVKNNQFQKQDGRAPIQNNKPVQSSQLQVSEQTPTLIPEKKTFSKVIELPPSADPAKVELLQEKFREMVNLALENNMYVMNRSVLEKAWNKFVMFDGVFNILLQGKYGGQCGEFAEWGEKWTNSFAEEIFGEGVIVDTIYIGEQSSISKETMLTDPFERIDKFIEANHAATRIILPTGETYILDYWQAIGDHQRGLFEKSVEIAYDNIFGGKPKYPEIKIMTEKEWIKLWRPKIETMFDKAVVHNMNPSQELLRDLIRKCSSEEEAFENYKKGIFGKGVKMRRLSDQQSETIINSYKRGGIWWDQSNFQWN